ncbi:MAG: hypothetical protein QOG89_589 [Thermomicrobiales bacterium]|nr:hypothetical protein [Thermomicrobiales bacterium]
MPGIDDAIEMTSADQFAAWLVANGPIEREVWVAIYKKASGKQVVGFDPLLETALCHGWVDVQSKGINAERYGIRFVPRRPGSNWSATNRAIVKRLLAEGRMAESGKSLLPPDL